MFHRASRNFIYTFLIVSPVFISRDLLDVQDSRFIGFVEFPYATSIHHIHVSVPSPPLALLQLGRGGQQAPSPLPPISPFSPLQPPPSTLEDTTALKRRTMTITRTTTRQRK